MSAPVVLAASSDALAGPAALLIVLVLLIATVLLIRNMDQRLKRLPREFPPPEDGKQGTALREVAVDRDEDGPAQP